MRKAPCSFNPRPLARANVNIMSRASDKPLFQSTPSCEGEQSHALATVRRVAGFNPRPLARANGRCDHDGRDSVRFNPRPLARANTQRGCADKSQPGVSIHALLRGRTGLARTKEEIDQFQSTPSCEGEPSVSSATNLAVSLFQSTPSCEGERVAHLQVGFVNLVSIHALLRGRTTHRAPWRKMCLLFQSTPSCEGERRSCSLCH